MQNIQDLYPVFSFKEISYRLGKEKCYFKQIKHKSPVIIVSSPCSWQILGAMDGSKTIAEIVNTMALLFEVSKEVLLSDIREMLEPLISNNILVLQDTANKQISPALKIVAPTLRHSLHIDLTELCNENCIHCLADKDGKTLRKDIVLSALEDGAKAGLTALSLSGGEALLHPSFWEIIKYAKNLGYSITLFSNGLNIDDNCAKQLADLILESVRLSIYSLDEKIHDSITLVKGSLKKTLSAAENLKKYGNNVFINCPIMKINYTAAENVKNYAIKNNFDFNLDPNIQPARDGRKSNDEIQLSHQEKKHIVELMFPKGPLGYNVEKDKIICAAGSGENYYINSKGNVSLCPAMSISIGNINENSLYKIIAEDTLTVKCSNLTIDTLKKCKTCDLRRACQRCHARALRDSGDLAGCSKQDFAFALVYREIMQKRGVWKQNVYKETKDEVY